MRFISGNNPSLTSWAQFHGSLLITYLEMSSEGAQQGGRRSVGTFIAYVDRLRLQNSASTPALAMDPGRRSNLGPTAREVARRAPDFVVKVIRAFPEIGMSITGISIQRRRKLEVGPGRTLLPTVVLSRIFRMSPARCVFPESPRPSAIKWSPRFPPTHGAGSRWLRKHAAITFFRVKKFPLPGKYVMLITKGVRIVFRHDLICKVVPMLGARR